MDLRAYYRRIRDIATGFEDPSVVIVSCETPDGGRAGVKTEVPRELAAKLIAEGKAEQANDADAAAYRAEMERKWKNAAD